MLTEGPYLANSAVCDCEYGQQHTMNHVVDLCPLTNLKADCNNSIYDVNYDALNWLETTVTRALEKSVN